MTDGFDDLPLLFKRRPELMVIQRKIPLSVAIPCEWPDCESMVPREKVYFFESKAFMDGLARGSFCSLDCLRNASAEQHYGAPHRAFVEGDLVRFYSDLFCMGPDEAYEDMHPAGTLARVTAAQTFNWDMLYTTGGADGNVDIGCGAVVDVRVRWRRYVGLYAGGLVLVERGEGKTDSGCFITSAVCREHGLADDCPDLTTLRRFRDGYMRETHERRALIDQYYLVAPALVAKLERRYDRAVVYDTLRHRFILPAVEAARSGCNPEAMKLYARMIAWLERTLRR